MILRAENAVKLLTIYPPTQQAVV